MKHFEVYSKSGELMGTCHQEHSESVFLVVNGFFTAPQALEGLGLILKEVQDPEKLKTVKRWKAYRKSDDNILLECWLSEEKLASVTSRAEWHVTNEMRDFPL